jgi:hypothetical protein
MHSPLIRSLLLLGALCACPTTAVWAQTPDTLVPADYAAPVCLGDLYAPYDAKNNVCTFSETKVAALDEKACADAGFKPNDKKVCTVGDAKAVKPVCKALPSYDSSHKEGKCTYTKALARSSPGDYLGDCFKIVAVPEGTDFKPGMVYAVTDQKVTGAGGTDRELTLAEGKISKVPLGCRAEQGPLRTVLASTLVATGAWRHGYTYGFLTMPFKYFPSERGFTSQAPIGGYLGWRRGQAGSGYTLAGAFTVGSVKANTVDPKTKEADGSFKVTGSADVAALSLAVGVMFDIIKAPQGKPFKAGFFVGQDRVNSDPSVQYRFNRKTWVALQLGYDFTDN